jgi:hypothetical protein
MARALRTLSAIVLYMCIAAPISAQNTRDINHSSTGANVSLTQSNDLEIQRLTGEVGKARSGSDTWDTATNLILLVGALVGIGIAIAAIGSSRAKSRVINLQDDLAAAKEAHLSLVLSANEREAARLRELAENERLARVKLEKEIQPRTISESEREEISAELKKFAPALKGRKVKISSQTGDAEGMLFSLEIMDILNRSGIDVDAAGMGALIEFHAVAMGVVITGPPQDQEFIRSLVGALNAKLDPSVGTSVYGEWKPQYTAILVTVGVKPIVGLPKGLLHQEP